MRRPCSLREFQVLARTAIGQKNGKIKYFDRTIRPVVVSWLPEAFHRPEAQILALQLITI
jgi:hypothetical protein